MHISNLSLPQNIYLHVAFKGEACDYLFFSLLGLTCTTCLQQMYGSSSTLIVCSGCSGLELSGQLVHLCSEWRAGFVFGPPFSSDHWNIGSPSFFKCMLSWQHWNTCCQAERSFCNLDLNAPAPIVLLRFSSICEGKKIFLAWFDPLMSLRLIHSRHLGKIVQSVFQLGLQIPPGVSGIPVIAASKKRNICALAHIIERRG